MKMAQQIGVDITKEEWYSYDANENHWANAQTEEGSMWVGYHDMHIKLIVIKV